MTVADAAERLDITKEAVRKRISRRTLRSDKDPDGTVHVYVPSSGTASGTASEPIGRNELVELLRTQLEDLRADRDAWREQARRSDYMAGAAMERTRELESRIRELEAPQGERESPESVEEEPDRAEPRPAAGGGAQEGTERPQQRSGWLAPVDKLPWWQYALGLSLVFAAGFLGLSLARGFVTNNPGLLILFSYVIFGALTWSPPGIFGFWVGYRRRNLRLLSQIVPLGALVGGVGYLGLKLAEPQVPRVASLYLELFPVWLLFVSASLLGNTWQRRRVGRISGSTPASPVFRTTQGNAQQPRKDLTPTQQAMLGWGGAIISALITLVATIMLGK